MKVIRTPEDFYELINSTKAVLFLNFAWSGYTKITVPYIRNWMQNSTVLNRYNIDTFEFFPEDEMNTLYMDWLNKQEQGGRKILPQLKNYGYGDVVWFQNGEAVKGLSLVNEIKKRNLTRSQHGQDTYDALPNSQQTEDIQKFTFQLFEDTSNDIFK